ncbi:hypothetical protein B0A48_17826 [Cryoendolithus antarcticus]|uniref:PCI domain-containing protein n=1 Tax=Cryoendolithus antarcticus TaxID=1507870 RepID=A0A1V8SAM8_9PEZI|nr:hypothetical protein B0A48_17826 [Cryoendolithus antarcticus]
MASPLPSVGITTFDLESHTSNYTPPLLPLRLLHIAAHCPPLSHQALTLALEVIKLGKDVSLYHRATDLASLLGHADLAVKDTEWLARREDANRRELTRLEGELKGYKNNLIRESIRMGQEDLALHLSATGGQAAAVTKEDDPEATATPSTQGLVVAYTTMSRVRDYCSTPSHIAGLTLRLQQIALQQAVTAQQTGLSASPHWQNVLATSNRLKSVGVKEEEQVLLTPLAAAGAGLAHLCTSDYISAAKSFLSVPFGLATQPAVQGVNFTASTASANDIAIYGALTSLATLSREELQTKVLDSPFRAFLELEPHVRKAISLYLNAKYSACMALLSRYHADWSLDLYLGAGLSQGHSHVDRLFARIREKSITAYFSSFSSVSLSSLASTFPPTGLAPSTSKEGVEKVMETEILSLISSGALNARLDAVNGTVVAPSKDARVEAHAEAGKLAEEVERGLRLRLHRVNCLISNLEIVGAGAPGGKGGKAAWGVGY